MTDFTTAHLECLLEQATPGPWEYEGPQFQEITTLDQDGLEQSVISLDRYSEKETCNRPADMNLAAHAPELAEEVIRLREHFEGLITTMENKAGVSNGRDTLQELIVAENLMSAANQLRQILLGDHDD
ncbi:MAG: hypothetical protein DI609_10925 [Corynebacterium urealyticum]|uniref:Uncharacterized protein n=1 Tax=Corynebacterium urealyticum TaxID=43771 RepID=A0A2W5AUS2_9CORY|nr:MAG: hypothetical protein DI609_10925 [Corynebacterium urealyticum]